MKNIKKCIIILILFIIILAITILVLLKNVNSNNDKANEIQEEGFEFSTEIDNKYRLISSHNDYFRISKIINIYYNFVAELNGEIEDYMILGTEEEYDEEPMDQEQYKKEQKEQTKKALLGMLGSEYINEFDITLENIEDIVKEYYCDDFIIGDVYYSQINTNVEIYFVNVDQFSKNNTKPSYFVIILDTQNNTFYLYLDEYIKAHNLDKYQINEEVKIDITSIDDRIYNKTNYTSVGSNEITQEYFKKYKKMLENNKEKLFNYLNEEYKAKKFATIQEFNEYISKNEDYLKKSNIVKYNKQVSGNVVQYIAEDNNGKYIIFQETSPMQYTVILDTYTIDLPEFTEKYNSATDENKVLMNIQRVFDAINDGDYKYAYNKLDPTFRTNNFKTLADFENYVKKNFFSENKLASGKVEKQSDIYLYDIIISDASGKNINNVNKTFVMQLKEGTDFVMSFNVK